MKLKLAVVALFTLLMTSCKPTEIKNTNDITGKQWQLKTLNGKEITYKEDEQTVYFILTAKENNINGFSGCNRFFGSYTLEEGNRIRFSKLGSTMMACLDEYFNEREFLDIFDKADNFTLVDGVLSLNVGRRAPLAVFEVMPKK
ncbi:META domain-containing protein [Flavobacterium sp.]|uniref:META domain-containing protein n=1 Tax=Flavobacterium sp. TaxID=239 RepID=UPI0026373A4E|nr:META domain-containing protein [Flavobacterium sp.]MDD3004543.1 META domain-containing protein [Flavobacterium sp.]